MARKPTLNADALVALGPEKLAQLVLDEAGRNAPFRKIINAALAGLKGPEAVARQIDRRLAALAKARAYIDWQKERAFRMDLAATVTTIAGELGPASPILAVDRLLRFIATHASVFDRVDDSSGRIQAVYQAAVDAVAPLVETMDEEDRRLLPERLQLLLEDDNLGYGGKVAASVIPLLPQDVLTAWNERLARYQEELGDRSAGLKEWERGLRNHSAAAVRQAIAEARGDLDAFIALESAKGVALQDNISVAERLLAAGRAAEALDWVRREGRRSIGYLDDTAFADGSGVRAFGSTSRALLEARILEALGRKRDAQSLRWCTFEENLDAAALGEHLARLGDFEEFDVLDRAFAHVMAAENRYWALHFLLAWPRLDLAAEFVVLNRAHWDGRHYDLLGSAAEALAERYPLAATILTRALLDDILQRARSSAYGHAARYLQRLDSLAGEISQADLEGAGLADHQTYLAGLRKAHGRKSGFWSQTIR